MDTLLTNLKVNWQKYLFFLLILFLPLTHKESFSIFDPDLIWSKFVLVVIAVIGLYYFFHNFNKYRKDIFFLLLSSILFFQLVSLFQTLDLYSSLRFIAFQTAVLFVYPYVKNLFANGLKLKEITNVYLIGFIFVFLFLLVQIYLQDFRGVSIGGVWPVPEYPTRFGSTFWDVNHFGAFLGSIILLFTGALISAKNKSRKLVFLIAILVGLFALLKTGSRSGFIGFLAGSILFAGTWLMTLQKGEKRNLPYFLFYSIGLLIPATSIGFIWLFADQIKEVFLYRAVSFFSHLFLLKVGIQVGFENPLLGIGVNSFYAYFKNSPFAEAYYYIDAAALNSKLPLHNLWLESFAETGLFSLIVFTIFWIVLLGTLVKEFVVNRNYFSLSLASGLMVFLTAGLMYSYKGEFFWIFVLIAAGFASRKINLHDIKNLIAKKSLINFTAGLVSAIAIAIGLIFIVFPMTPDELKVVMLQGGLNPVSNLYFQLIDLFRYVFGNYSYTPRLVSIIFYFAAITLLWGVLSRYYNRIAALLYLALLVSAFSLFGPAIRVSFTWFGMFLILSTGGFVTLIFSLFRNEVYKFSLSNRNKIAFIVLILFFTLAGIYRSVIYFRSAYDSNLVFITELAYNRRHMDGANIWIDDTFDPELLFYYCDEVEKEKGLGFVIDECEAKHIALFTVQDLNSKKNLFIGASKSISYILEVVSDKYSLTNGIETTRVDSGDSSLLLIEKKR